GMTPAIWPSSAAPSSASAASCCVLFRSTKKETKTFASATTLRTLDATSRLARFGDSRERVGAVLDEALQCIERGAFRRDRDAGAADFPPQFCARLQVERFAHFLRDRRLSFAGHRRDWHAS